MIGVWERLGEIGEEKKGAFGGLARGGAGADSIEDEVDNGVSKEGNDKTKEGIKDSVLGVGDFLIVAARDNIAKAAPDEHDYGNEADDVESGVSKTINDAIGSNEFGRHAVGASSLSTFLNGECHSFAGAEGQSSTDASGDL